VVTNADSATLTENIVLCSTKTLFQILKPLNFRGVTNAELRGAKMQLTKTETITIEVEADNPKNCSPHCTYNEEGIRVCTRYMLCVNILRCPKCVAEFGMGEV